MKFRRLNKSYRITTTFFTQLLWFKMFKINKQIYFSIESKQMKTEKIKLWRDKIGESL